MDLLVEYLLVWPAKRVGGWASAKLSALRTRFARKRTAAAPSTASAAAGGAAAAEAESGSGAEAGHAGGGGAGGLADGKVDGPARAATQSLFDEDEPMHAATKVVERRTLGRLMPTAWSVIKHLPRKLSIQVGSCASSGVQSVTGALLTFPSSRSLAPVHRRWLSSPSALSQVRSMQRDLPGPDIACLVLSPAPCGWCWPDAMCSDGLMHAFLVPCRVVLVYVQEPMFKEVVVLYRTSGAGRRASRKKVPVRGQPAEERLKVPPVLLVLPYHVYCLTCWCGPCLVICCRCCFHRNCCTLRDARTVVQGAAPFYVYWHLSLRLLGPARGLVSRRASWRGATSMSSASMTYPWPTWRSSSPVCDVCV